MIMIIYIYVYIILLSVLGVALLLLTKIRRKQTVFWKGSAKTTRAVTNDILQERVTSLQAPGKWKEIYPAAQLRNLENVFGDKCEKP